MTIFLTREIIYYSVIPTFIAFLFIMITYLLSLKKNKKKFLYYNYFVKVMITIMICSVLPLIVGYTFWVIEFFSSHQILLERISYIILIIFLSLCLLTLLIWVYLRTLKLVGLIKDEKEKNTLE